jgi:hypothetical protein
VGENTYCKGNKTTLTASGAIHYLWNTGDTTATIDVGEDNVYWVRGFSEDRNCFSEPLVMQVSQEPEMDVKIEGNAMICNGDSVLITASGALSYLWDTGEKTAGIYIKEGRKYQVECTNSRGCTKTYSFTADKYNYPLAGFNQSASVIDIHHNLIRFNVMQPEPNVNYEWNFGDGTTSSSVNPIAKIATLLAVGFTLDEITNDITGTAASFEPVIDYIVTKVPRFTFEKFPKADSTLTTSMKSVGEAMAIGRTFNESIQKALCSMETGLVGFDRILGKDLDFIKKEIRRPNDKRLLYLMEGMRQGLSNDDIFQLSKIDPWFLTKFREIYNLETSINESILTDADFMRKIKTNGFSDKMIASLIGKSEEDIYKARKTLGVDFEYNEVDTCSAEFKALTPYLYSTTNITKLPETKKEVSTDKKVMIIGGGPNRIGQGIEFDYCCVHASFALNEMGVKTIMYNCNPETVSTDYDTSDILYFEPIDFEHVRSVVEKENPDGVTFQKKTEEKAKV